MADSPLKLVREFFDTPSRPMKISNMKDEWVPLSDEDKAQILQGLTDGTLTY